MKDADELFRQNPLKAIWIRLGKIEKVLDELDENPDEGNFQYD